MASNERIGTALNSKNLKSDDQHTDADVIAALAFASRLGSSLQALRSGGHNAELGISIGFLAVTLVRAGRRRRIGIGAEKAEMIAKQALLEWMIRICKACNGTGAKLLSYDAPSTAVHRRQHGNSCSHCNGSGVFMPTWAWRRQTMGVNPEDGREWWEKRIEFAKEIADDAYLSAKRKVTAQLVDLGAK